ncbi:hypothetical protein EV174_004741 [Coemansia sp. RSA 2320]|nr:hypothetical protein EV174_004741 [Coemansia sp. RSA 2320]
MVQRSLAQGSFGLLIDESNVFARVSPAQKLRLVHALQARGEVVAFIGDGINDAPSLTRADVGICMGANPSTADVAMDAAGLIVLSGSFSGVVRSLREGRRLSANAEKCMAFHLACKLALVLLFALLLLGEGTSPMTPVQIIVVKLAADLGATRTFLAAGSEGVVPAARAGEDCASLAALSRAERLFFAAGRKPSVIRTASAYALILFAACALPLLLPSLLLPSWAVAAIAPTMTFLAWMLAHALLGISMCTSLVPLRVSCSRRQQQPCPLLSSRRSSGAGGHSRTHRLPGVLWLASILAVLVLASTIPPLSAHLGVVPLDAAEWAVVIVSPLLMFAGLELVKEPAFSLRIIHTNDLHAHYSPFNQYGSDCSDNDRAKGACFGGAARLTTTINQLRSGHPNSLLLDAGDQAQGTLFYTVGKFNTTVQVMNSLRYDAMCIGNHEFDDGPDFLATFFRKLNFPAICANIDTSGNPKLAAAVKPYIIIDKYQLGIIGYITNTTGSISSAGPTVSFTDAATAVNKYVQILRDKGIKRIIAVSHNGYHEDMDVAARTHGLDLIVGGHSHTYLALNASEPGAGGAYPTPVANLDGHTTFIVQAKAWGEYVGYVDVEFAQDGSVAALSGAPIHMTLDVAEDPDMAAKVIEWRKPFEDYGNALVGSMTAGVSNTNCKIRECELGDIAADAMLWSLNQHGISADVAIINGGGVRAGIAPGPTKVKDVLLVFPFGNSVVSLSIDGKQLEQIIVGVFRQVNVANGRPIAGSLQIAGARIKVHSAVPGASNGAQVVDSIEIAEGSTNSTSWVPLDKTRVYRVATLDFISRGGDNIIGTPIDAPALQGLDEAVEDYFRQFSPITPRLAGRIIDTGLNK